MQYLVSAKEMQQCDKRTIEHYHMPSLVLMERAALACVEEILAGSYDLSLVGVVCGMGNNGGDGLAVARLLHQRQIPVRIFCVGKKENASEQTKVQLDIIKKYQIPGCWLSYEEVQVDSPESVSEQLEPCTLFVDALFGVGLSRNLKSPYNVLIADMNKLPAPVVSVDMPSGIDATTGKVFGCAINADMTVTFAFCKAGLCLYPGADYAGRVVVKEIGITEDGFVKKPRLYTCETEEILSMLPQRPKHSHKGTFGRVVLVAGSKGMAGAAYLAATAAYRMGCGLVRIVTVEDNRSILQTLLPEAILTTYKEEEDITEDGSHLQAICEALEWGDVIGIGPGLGQGKAAEQILRIVLTLKGAIVIDGDGLNILAKHEDWLSDIANPKSSSLIVTPHMLEMSRLNQKSVKNIQKHFVETAMEYAKEHHVCCVLKDARTVVAKQDGSVYLNMTGNSGMAVGGSGDVLAGMLCGLLAQGMEPYKAAVAAVHIHGRAGDLAADELGEYSLLARDIVENIGNVMAKA